MTEETWKAIPGWPDYEASTLGRIRSWKCWGDTKLAEPVVMSPQSHPGGYRLVGLRKDGKKVTMSVHRLVLLTFKGSGPVGAVARHGMLGKENDSIENLEWGTYSDNNGGDRHRDGTALLGEKSPNAKLTDAQAIEIINRYGPRHPKSGRAKHGLLSSQELASEYGISRRQISRLIKGDTFPHLDSVRSKFQLNRSM